MTSGRVSTQGLRVCDELVDLDFVYCPQLEEAISKDILVIAFSVTDPRSLSNVMLQYLPLVKKRSNQTDQIMFLMGINAHERDSNDRKHISREQAEQSLRNLKGYMYLEIDKVQDVGILLRHLSKVVLREEKTQANKSSNWVSKQKELRKSPHAEALNLKRCKLEFLPPQVLQSRFTLTHLKLSHNQFKFFPEEILLLESLLEVDLSDNMIGDFPPDVLSHATLVKLNLENNRISVLAFGTDLINGRIDIRLKGNPAHSSYQKLLKKLPEESILSPRNNGEEDEEEVQLRSVPVFGTELVALLEYERRAFPTEKIDIPRFVKAAINHILSSSLELQGLFRLEGNSTQMVELKEKLNTYLKGPKLHPLMDNVNNSCGLLKMWLRLLPTPLLVDLPPLVEIMNEMDDDLKLENMKKHLHTLPSPHFAVLEQIIRLMFIVQKNSGINKMDAQNLSTVMGTNLIWSKTDPTSVPKTDILEEIQKSQEATKFLIENYERIFVGEGEDVYENDPLSHYTEATAVLRIKLVGKHKSITSACFGKGYNRIWTADEKGLIHLWDATTHTLLEEIDAGQRINTMIQSGNTIWVGSIASIQIRDVGTGTEVKRIEKPGYMFTRAGSNILSSLYTNNEGVINCLNPSTYEIIREVKINERIVAMTSTDNQIWAACQDNSIRVWSLDLSKEIARFDSIHEDAINHLCFVPPLDSSPGEVWSSSKDCAVHVWHAQTRELEERLIGFHKKGVNGACAMGNQVWTYTWDARVRIWDRKSRDYLGSLCSYHSQPISSVVSNWEDNEADEEWDTASVSYDHSLVLWRCRNLL